MDNQCRKFDGNSDRLQDYLLSIINIFDEI